MSRLANIPLLATAYVAVAVSNLLMTLVIGNALGPYALGEYAMATTVARMFYAVTDGGLGPHLTKEVTRERARAFVLGPPIEALRLWLVPACVAVALSTAWMLGSEHAAVYVAVAVALGCVNLQLVYEALLLGNERQRASAALTSVGALAVIAAAGVWTALGGSLLQITTAYAVACAVGYGVSRWWVGRHLAIQLSPSLTSAPLREAIAAAWPIGASALVGFSALRCSTLLLGSFAHPEDVGAFAAAEMFVTAAGILQAAISNAFYPQLASSFGRDPARYQRLFWQSLGLQLCAGVVVALVLTFGADLLLALVFPGRDFASMRPLMPVIGWSTPAMLVAHHMVLAFAATNRQRANLIVMCAWMFAIATTQTVAISQWGLEGAAWGLLVGRCGGLVIVVISALVARVHLGTAGADQDA